MEHLHHFQLTDDPFRADPLERYDVELPSQERALARLDRGVRQGKGLLLLVGGVGAGKTRLARRLYEELEEEVFEASMMLVLRREVGSDWLLARFAAQLGVEDPEAEREALIAQIFERLAIIHEDGRRAVLIIDDAHGLANAETLSEVCSLVKLEYEDRRLVTIVLVGAPELDAAMAADPQLAHHVDVRVVLAPLEREEASLYLAGRIAAAGGGPELVLPGAGAALHELADGMPGRLNVLADNALFEAFLAGRDELTRGDVERAHRDLGWAAVGGAPASDPATAPAASAGPAAPRRAPARRAPANAQAEQTIVNLAAPAVAGPVADLDSELDAAFGEAAPSPASELMDFDSDPAPGGALRASAEPTQVQLHDVEPPPKADDEVDDLFMELLDD